MQKLMDFISGKALTDTSMANVMDLLKHNPGHTEEILTLAFASIYEANQRLAKYALKVSQTAKEVGAKKIITTDSWEEPSSTPSESRK